MEPFLNQKANKQTEKSIGVMVAAQSPRKTQKVGVWVELVIVVEGFNATHDIFDILNTNEMASFLCILFKYVECAIFIVEAVFLHFLWSTFFFSSQHILLKQSNRT